MSVTLDEHLARYPVDPERLDDLVQQLHSRVRAWRLREVRHSRSMTQAQMAEEMGIGQNRVSAIERGDLSSTQVSTLRRYVEALGGQLRVEAQFGDTAYVIAR